VGSVTIERSVELAAPASRVWAATRTPAAFRYVTRGLLRITGLPRTGRFGQGARIKGWLLLGGVLPLLTATVSVAVEGQCRHGPCHHGM
jgi:uncharacterized protein YndB with AHSA1/START domain